MAATTSDVEYSAKDVAAHRSAGDGWMVINGEVYDVTKYINDHPGGAEVLLESMGTDATEAFDNAGHSEDAFEIMAEYRIGKLKANGRRPAPKAVRVNSSPSSKPASSSGSKSTSSLISPGTALLSLGAVTAGCLGYFYRSSLPGSDSISLLRAAGQTSTSGKSGMGFIHGIMLSASIFVAVDALIVKRAMKLLQPDEGGFLRYPPHMKVPKAVDADLLLQSGWLDPATPMTLPLTKKTLISPNVYRFTFELPTPQTIVGLPTGQHVAITATLPGTGEVVTRSYTPVSNNSDRGVLELVIKIYPDGKLTGQYLANLQVGDEVSFRGPKGAMRFRTGPASPSIASPRQLGMIAGGTGITPMYQLIRAICEDPRDTTRVSLIYANRSVDDILLRDELDSFARRYPQNLSVYYVVNTAPENAKWEYGVGFINKDMMAEKLAPAVAADGKGDKSRVMLCGPPGMVNAAKAALVELGFEKPGASAKMSDQVFVF
ncbi:oxidoreductase NAD-binding domain-containing protein [Microdochium trichocladiopsis]|uniref:Oxidoreductase NAD-binding domain-containing protein n=1 Tax=Microdochium trichocladiopsis TaxID=1682393 RepID=A0A9P8XXL5_9PEZI|nr:oxidoreductase NAD-binding domain-containing protein [Microdochium trichocladiopsis]KAH7018328.1 oxidoreductase NAD-binding domain-containing protein [Microdochium trichocladiopsis]